MRKRHSFFGRTTPDDDSITSGMSALHATISSQGRDSPAAPRPGTASSERPRRKTEHFETIRNSIFGRRKKTNPSISSARLSTQPQSFSTPTDGPLPGRAELARAHFKTEDDYYHYLRKTSISLPFGFEHITHTAQQELPRLDTVNDKDLAAKFRALSAYRRPKHELDGIRAMDVTDKLEGMGVQRGAPSSRPQSPTSDIPAELGTDEARVVGAVGVVGSLNETMFDEVRDTRFDPKDAFRRSHSTRQPSRRDSSLGLLNEQRLRYLEQPPPPTFYDSQSSDDSDGLDEHSRLGGLELNEYAAALDSVPEERDSFSTCRDLPYIDRTKQPLPPLPPHAQARRHSKSSAKPSPKRTSIPRIPASDNRSSKWSTRSVQRSPVAPNDRDKHDTRVLSMLSDASTWEADVEFCYQQEAESTCDFDWQGVAPSLCDPPLDQSGSRGRVSACVPCTPLLDSAASSPSLKHASGRATTETPSSSLHTRGTSVGHRGFLAARKGSFESTRKRSHVPSALGLMPGTPNVSVLSPVYSIGGREDGDNKTTFSPDTLHFRGFDSVNSGSVEYLSDPESGESGESGHGKSSSYGSYESVVRPALNDGDRARWSFTSLTSVPDLLHSQRRSRQSIHKNANSTPLASLPQSPVVEVAGSTEESQLDPSAPDAATARQTLTMRRPQSTSDRTVLQAAGKAVQRSRPPAPSRFSRLIHADASALKSPEDRPGWI